MPWKGGGDEGSTARSYQQVAEAIYEGAKARAAMRSTGEERQATGSSSPAARPTPAPNPAAAPRGLPAGEDEGQIRAEIADCARYLHAASGLLERSSGCLGEGEWEMVQDLVDIVAGRLDALARRLEAEGTPRER